MTLKEFIDKAMYVPFKSHGRDYDGWDCYGLLYIGNRDVYRRELPSYRRDYKSIKDKERLEELIKTGLEESWEPTDQPKEGDSAIIYYEGREMHVGMMISEDKLIHTEAEINTCIQRLSDFRVEGVYRYRGIVELRNCRG